MSIECFEGAKNCFVFFQITIGATINNISKYCNRCFQSLFDVGEKRKESELDSIFFSQQGKLFLFFSNEEL